MLICENLCKSYVLQEGEMEILKNFNLHLQPASFNVLIGGNGAGKSTLLKLITADEEADQGKMFLRGRPLAGLKPHERGKKIAILRQDPRAGTIGSMSVLENLRLADAKGSRFDLSQNLPFFREKRLKVRDDYQSLLKPLDMGLEQLLDTQVQNLSGGQRQALALMMVTLHKPDLLLLDEHTAALDPKTSRQIMALTETYVRHQKICTLMITHELEDAIHFGDRLLMLKDGRLALDLNGQEKKALHVKDLLKIYYNAALA